jgi:hypothetical protein
MIRTFAWLCVSSIAVVACRGVSESEIEAWKGADKRGQIAQALASPKVTPSVRLKAARALVELAADAHFADALKKLERADREVIATGLGPELDRLLASPDLASQVLAKDFLGLLILAGDAGTAARSGAAIVRWISADLAARTALGKVSGLELLKAIGVPAIPALVAAITPKLDLVVLAKVIAGIGDTAGVQQAADRVAAIARAQGPKIPERTLRALFTLGGPKSSEHLAGLAADTRLSYPSRRAAAEELRALAHRGGLPVAAALAIDPEGDQLVRESTLVYLEKVCDAAACGRYLDGLFASLENPSLIFEAASAIVKVGGAAQLPRLLSEMPRGRGYTAKGIEGIADDIRKNIGAAALPAIRAAAKGDAGPGQLVAIRALAKLGGPKDAAALDAQKDDDTVPKGWKAKSTLGAEAAKAAAEIRARK